MNNRNIFYWTKDIFSVLVLAILNFYSKEMEAQNFGRGMRINYTTNVLLFTGIELINSPMCCKLKFIRMYNTNKSCRRTLLYVCMLVCKSAWLDFELITQFIVSRLSHSHKWKLSCIHWMDKQWRTALPSGNHILANILFAAFYYQNTNIEKESWPAKNESRFTRRVNAYKRWDTTTSATSDP